MRGGYIIVDVSGVTFTAGEVATIPGIYETLEGNYGKAVMLSEFTLDGTFYPASYVTFTHTGSYEGTAYGQKVTITAENAVTIGGE